jgi:tetratricopeptide (TPR) repeat protein
METQRDHPEAAGEAVPPPNIPGYEVLHLLGHGGMGVVYKARQLALNRVVALKMVRAGPQASPEDLLRFLTEAKAVARLNHPNIVQIYEIGSHQGQPYFSLEFVEGGSLDRLLARTPQPARPAAALVETLARAMQSVHEQGIIHRDLKPANILMVSGGVVSGEWSTIPHQSPLTTHQPKIADFGLAKRLVEGQSGLTPTQAILGTPEYMAPEQAWGKSRIQTIGPAADIYALGAILYEMVTGRPPFLGATWMDTVQQVVNTEPVPPARLQPAVPPDLETICLKCLDKDPRKRYATAGQLADDLHRFLAGEPIQARPVGRLTRSWKWARRNPVKAIVAAAAVFVAMVLVLWFQEAQRRRREADRYRDRQQAEAHADEGVAQTHIDAGRYDEAEKYLRRAAERLEDDSVLRDAWQRLEGQRRRAHALAQFARLANEGWFLAGEDDFDAEARATIAQALEAVGVRTRDGRFNGAEWWRRLPDDDLPPLRRRELRQEVYNQLILLALLQLREGIMRMTSREDKVWTMAMLRKKRPANRGRGLNPLGGLLTLQALLRENRPANQVMRAARDVLRQARALERGEGLPTTTTLRVLERECAFLIQMTTGRMEVQELLAPPKNARRTRTDEMNNASDCFIAGSALFFAAMFPDDPMSVLFEARMGLDLDFARATRLETAEELLRAGAKLDTGQVWPHFLLGWLLYYRRDYRAAELAFDRCVELRPNYPRGYQFRGQAIMRHALKLRRRGGRSAELARALFLRALDDFEKAQEQAARDPVTFWFYGDLFAQLQGEATSVLTQFAHALHQSPRFVDAYARALDLEDDDILHRPIRRNFLDEARGRVEKQIKADPRDADALAVLAHIHLKLKEMDRAFLAAEQTLALRSTHARARAVRGSVYLECGEPTRALEDFQAALNKAPANHLAALGQARAYEKLRDPAQALKAYEYLLTRPGGRREQVAATRRQQREAHKGQARALQGLGRADEARAAQREADGIDVAEAQRLAAAPRK